MNRTKKRQPMALLVVAAACLAAPVARADAVTDWSAGYRKGTAPFA